MASYNFKKIQTVPTASEFIDIVLSKTQRKTPTEVHKGYAIGRIRGFYMRKVKFTQESFDEKLNQILTDFPRLDDIHPFYADLMNVLYDKDHYKLALAQVNTARHLVDHVGKDYLRLLKFGDSLYRCKQLKIAALGRMATVMKRQKDSLAYLEQVRQHLARLPAIDPNTRTLLICGYPNVGKSSFTNKVTRAQVDVQPYAFTTKSLFVGHMDYKYLRWQVIDTPGILDHPLEQRNTIEMQSITALAHLRACVLFFLDLSENCGYKIAEQVALFESIKPLFANKPVVLVANKADIVTYDMLRDEDKATLQVLLDQGLEMIPASCMTDVGVMDVRNRACERLLAVRVEQKLAGPRLADVLSRLHVASPALRDNKERPVVTPAPRVKYDPQRIKLERDLEAENGGSGVYSIDLKKNYLLANAEWRYDAIPEIKDGKNIADFIDPEISARLAELEAEEERLDAEGVYVEAPVTEADLQHRATMKIVREHRQVTKIQHSLKVGGNSAPVPKRVMLKRRVAAAAVERTQKRSRAEERNESAVFANSRTRAAPSGQAAGALSKARGFNSDKLVARADKLRLRSQKAPQLQNKRGEADRSIQCAKPRHLFSGKRGIGSTDRR